MPTVLELSGRERKAYVEAIRRRTLSSPVATIEPDKYDQLIKRLRDAADMLKTRFGVRRVILFGSMTSQTRMTDASDIDLAVEGISGDAYWRAWRCVEDILDDRPVDFIDLDTTSPSLQHAILHHGVDL